MLKFGTSSPLMNCCVARGNMTHNEKAYCEVGAIELPQLHSKLFNSLIVVQMNIADSSSHNLANANVGCCFENNVLEYLKHNKLGDLHIMSDFYEVCLKCLELQNNTKDYWSNIRKIQYRLKKMKNKKLIDWRRTGTGFCGKTDFGVSSLNFYAIHGFWD